MFTIHEYILANKLGVDLRDTYGLKKVADHLRALGYHCTRRTSTNGARLKMWSKTDRTKEMAALDEKLAALAKKEGGGAK